MHLKCWPKGFRKEFLIVIICCVTDFMAGACRGYVAFLVPQLQSEDSPISVSKEEESWLGSLTILAMPFGCLIGGISTESFGRKSCLLGMFVPFCAGWAITAFARNMFMLYLGTILNGMAAGMSFCTTTYIAEICTFTHRGPLLMVEEPMFGLGAVFCNVVVHWFGWKSAAFYFLAFSVLCFFLLSIVPESPNWLVGNGQVEKAVEVLSKIRKTENEVKCEILEMEIHYELVKAIRKDIPSTVLDLLGCWRPFCILIGLFLLEQFSGYNILVSYTVNFFKELNLPFDSALAAIIYSTVGFLGCFMAPMAAVYFGRKMSLAVSGFGMAIFVALVAVYEMIYYNAEDKPYYWIALTGIFLYCLFGSFGVMTLPFTMSGELFPSHVSGIACGMYGCVANVLGGLILKAFPYCLSGFGIVVVLWALAVFSLLNVPYAVFVLPETRDKTITQIQEQYFKKRPNEKKTFTDENNNNNTA